jgi:aspartate racemase
VNQYKTIGVIAGAGPFAGLDLLKKIFEQTIASSDQEHLDVIGLFRSSKLPDRTAYLLNPELENPGLAIAAQALELESAGASVVGIPCNTAHSPRIFDVALNELRGRASSIIFVNMIAETVAYIRQHMQVQRIGILSTTGTYRVKLYPGYLEQAHLQAVVPDEDIQLDLIHPAIYDATYGIKATGTATPKSRRDLLTAFQHLVDKGAEAVILGCTEIPLAIPESMVGNTPTIDPTLILARALIREVDPAKLKPLNHAVE